MYFKNILSFDMLVLLFKYKYTYKKQLDFLEKIKMFSCMKKALIFSELVVTYV
jgi:hypothetical protein